MSEYKKKLIEVALPLEAINRESAAEKARKVGKPQQVHHWWARRPLTACRAVLFAQLVDDPSAHPDQFPTEGAQAAERQRLFDIIERLIVWGNINDEALLKEAYDEIVKSAGGVPPAILDPFAGGGSIPLEAQRLGLVAHASDLNPVAVLINKALIEIPPKWSEQSPVFPGAAEAKMLWPRATGLSEDVRRYGQWIRDEAEKCIGHLYPEVKVAASKKKVIAWIWARTIICPNPGCGIEMPLVRSWWLAKKKGREAYVIPQIVDGQVEFTIGHDAKQAPQKENDGTVDRTGARCLACGTAAPLTSIRAEGQAGRIGVMLMAIVAEGDRRRNYFAPTKDHLDVAQMEPPTDIPDADLSTHPQYMGTPRYGLTRQSDLFTARQLTALTTFSKLIGEVRDVAHADALKAGMSDDLSGLEAGGTGAKAYSQAIGLYLALVLSRLTDWSNALCRWEPMGQVSQQLFGKQSVSMVWDFSEANPLGTSSGSWVAANAYVTAALEKAFCGVPGHSVQADAARRNYSDVVVSTDPPYYDNIPYADLSDFFYGWLRNTLNETFPSLFDMLQVPKQDELVADQYRLGSKKQASDFFEAGFMKVFANIRRDARLDYPVTVFYAFKQIDGDDENSASTGWQTLLEGMLRAGWEVTATWPIRTEAATRQRALGANALATSVVLALRARPAGAETIGRRGFVQSLKSELPRALRELQQGSIAPVDLAQAAIGPGMAVFSGYARVLEADGSDMTVRTALALINQALGEVLTDQEGDFDPETRFAVKWFSQYGWNEVASGEADVLTRAVNTTVAMLERGGIFRAAAGKARLLEPSEMSKGWNPADDKEISVWEVAVRLGHALLTEGTDQASVWMREAASRVDLNAVKELSYLMYSVCERKGWTESAMLFNALGTSWSDVAGAARAAPASISKQGSLDFGDDDE